MHLAWKIYLAGGLAIGAFFLIVLVVVLYAPPPPEGSPSNDAMMGPVLIVIVYGISSICTWNTVRTTSRYQARAR